MLAHCAVRRLIRRAAGTARKDPDRISCARAVRVPFIGVRQPEPEAVGQAMDVERIARDVQSDDRLMRQVSVFPSFRFGIRMAASNRSRRMKRGGVGTLACVLWEQEAARLAQRSAAAGLGRGRPRECYRMIEIQKGFSEAFSEQRVRYVPNLTQGIDIACMMSN